MGFALKLDVVLIYKNSNRSNAKVRMKVYRYKAIDEILDASYKQLHIPEKSEVIQIGFGSGFKEKYKEKYKI